MSRFEYDVRDENTRRAGHFVRVKRGRVEGERRSSWIECVKFKLGVRLA